MILYFASIACTFLSITCSFGGLFKIRNHGLLHRPCSINGETRCGIPSTQNIVEVREEMELNARKIEQLTGKRPKFFVRLLPIPTKPEPQ